MIYNFIDVNKRLPTIEEDVLIKLEQEEYVVGYRDCDGLWQPSNVNSGYDMASPHIEGDPIAWCKLPEENYIMEETITITKKEYNRLQDVDRWRDSLDAAGVDNWQGIDLAYDIFNKMDED